MNRVEELEAKLEKIKKYKNELNRENISDFESLINDIDELLNEDMRIKFSQLNFYEEISEGLIDDDLPF